MGRPFRFRDNPIVDGYGDAILLVWEFQMKQFLDSESVWKLFCLIVDSEFHSLRYRYTTLGMAA